jgi:CheY-like chemotaxis protein
VKILLMEDERSLQKAVPRMIRAALGDDVDIDVTDSVPTAIAMLQHTHYDAIVSDYDVLRGTGADLLAWVRAEQPTLVARFVFFTGNNDVKEFHTKIITKGICIDDFVAQLCAHLASGVAA